jgi:hypothetical protein
LKSEIPAYFALTPDICPKLVNLITTGAKVSGEADFRYAGQRHRASDSMTQFWECAARHNRL